MKANNRRKVFGDAVDLLMEDIEEKTAPGGLRMLSIKKIRPFHDHPFHLYEGDRLEDMVVSVREHGILNPVIVQEIDGGYEMLSGHNRMNAANEISILHINECCKNFDKLPDLDVMREKLETADVSFSYNNIVMIGLGEYLALCGDKRANDILGEARQQWMRLCG